MLPYYHLVSDEDLVHVRHLFRYRDVRTFNEDLDFLLKHYDPVALDDVIAAVSRGTKLPRHSFLLTFDDGFREIHDVVAPVLLARGIPAVFFLNTSFLDNRALFFRCKASILADSVDGGGSSVLEGTVLELRSAGVQAAGDARANILSVGFSRRHVLDRIAELLDVDFQLFLREHKPYLTSDQVRSLQDDGFHIGAHSADHPLYSDLDLPGQLNRAFDSLAASARTCHPPHTLFSFPFRSMISVCPQPFCSGMWWLHPGHCPDPSFTYGPVDHAKYLSDGYCFFEPRFSRKPKTEARTKKLGRNGGWLREPV